MLSSRRPSSFSEVSFFWSVPDARPVGTACGFETSAGKLLQPLILAVLTYSSSAGALDLLTEKGQVVPDRSSFTEGSPRARSVLGESGPERFFF
jgi:hypothetical protein